MVSFIFSSIGLSLLFFLLSICMTTLFCCWSLYCSIQLKHWTLIKSLHTNASSAIKFNGLVSENFNILHGVRQIEILSADLYKIYIDPLLKQLQQSRLGVNPLCSGHCCGSHFGLSLFFIMDSIILQTTGVTVIPR
jgi:hypothetical protein